MPNHEPEQPTPESAGHPPEPEPGPTPTKHLRGGLWRPALILGVLLLFTSVVSRACGGNGEDIEQRDAVNVAIEQILPG